MLDATRLLASHYYSLDAFTLKDEKCKYMCESHIFLLLGSPNHLTAILRQCIQRLDPLPVQMSNFRLVGVLVINRAEEEESEEVLP